MVQVVQEHHRHMLHLSILIQRHPGGLVVLQTPIYRSSLIHLLVPSSTGRVAGRPVALTPGFSTDNNNPASRPVGRPTVHHFSPNDVRPSTISHSWETPTATTGSRPMDIPNLPPQSRAHPQSPPSSATTSEFASPYFER